MRSIIIIFLSSFWPGFGQLVTGVVELTKLFCGSQTLRLGLYKHFEPDVLSPGRHHARFAGLNLPFVLKSVRLTHTIFKQIEIRYFQKTGGKHERNSVFALNACYPRPMPTPPPFHTRFFHFIFMLYEFHIHIYASSASGIV